MPATINRTDIQPGYGSRIELPNRSDVLCGRGARINSHPGNVYFRALVNEYKHSYLDKHTRKLIKVNFASHIVKLIRSTDPPGRFLKQDIDTQYWKEIGDEKARKKAGQAMREKAAETRREIERNKVTHLVSDRSVYAPASVLVSPLAPRTTEHTILYNPVPMHIISSPMPAVSHVTVPMHSDISTQRLNWPVQHPLPYRPYSEIQTIIPGELETVAQAPEQGEKIISAKEVVFNRDFNILRDTSSSSDVSSFGIL